MRKAEGRRQKAACGDRQRRRRLRCLLLSSFCLLPSWTLQGCAGTRSATDGDPLLGGGRPLSSARAPAPLRPPEAPFAATSLPPLPAATGATSNAALAAGPPRLLDSSRDLRIADPRTVPASTWPNPVAASSPPPGGGALLRQPQPLYEPVARRDSPVGTAVGSNAPRPLTYEQVQAQLAARGVLWQKLETSGETGEWKFTCSIPNRQNPNIRRTYEARDRDPLAAIQAALEQMGKDQN